MIPERRLRLARWRMMLFDQLPEQLRQDIAEADHAISDSHLARLAERYRPKPPPELPEGVPQGLKRRRRR